MFAEIGLSAKDMEVLSLHYYDGRSYAEIGAYFGITKQSIKDRVHKCLRYFRRYGIPEPQHKRPGKHGKPRLMDPWEMDEMFAETGI